MIKQLLKSILVLISLTAFGQCGITISSTGSDTICRGGNSYKYFTAAYAGTGTLYWYTNGTGTINSYNNGLNAYYNGVTNDPAQITVYATIIDSMNACFNASGSKMIWTKAQPTLQLTPHGAITKCTSDSNLFLNANTNAASVQWSKGSVGTGTFTSTTDSNTYYFYSAADKVNGAVAQIVVTGANGCTNYDSVWVTFSGNAAVVDAGADYSGCDSMIAISGSAINSASTTWSTSGTGFFSNVSSLSTNYFPSQADKINGGVVLTLSGVGCGSVTDTKNLVLMSPYLNGGSDQLLQSSNTITAFAAHLNSISWASSGTGSFTTTNGTSTTYMPSAADWASGSVTITITGNSTCGGTITDEVMLTSLCQVDLGPTRTICKTSDSIALSAIMTGPDSIIWSCTGSGTFSNEFSPYPIYSLSPADKNAGVLVFTTNALGNGCHVFDSLFVYLDSTQISGFVPSDKAVCSNQHAIYLNGYSTGANKQWYTSGTGTFSNAHHDSTIYYPSGADYANGTVVVGLSSSGGCGYFYDSLSISFNQGGPVVHAGPNQSLAASVSLSATVSGAAGVVWTTSGTGTFANSTALTTTYSPSGADLASGFVVLGITTTGNGSCSPGYDSLFLTDNAQVCNVSISSTVTGNQVSFTASNTDNQSIGSYYWNYGDGNYAYGKFQQHTYATAGVYPVSCNFITQDSSCSSTSYDSVLVSNVTVSTYTISGTVFVGLNTADHAHVSLFSVDGDYFEYLNSEIITPNDHGNYAFHNIPNGHYVVFAFMADHSAYQNYTACYYPNAGVWANATEIVVSGSDQTGKIITMIEFIPPATNWNTGTDTIKGSIKFDIPLAARTTASSDPVQFAVVSLYNASNQLLATVNTDQYGSYSFDGIATGSYSIKVEYPGGTTSSTSYSVSVDGDPQTTSSVAIDLARQQISVDISDVVESDGFKLYPNPSSGEVYLELTEKAATQVYVYNAHGILVYSKSFDGQAPCKVSMSEFHAGIYTVRMVQSSNTFQSKIVKY